MIWAVDIDTQDPEFRLRFYREALSREVLLRPLGTTVYFMPPYILNDEEAALLAERAVAALDAALPLTLIHNQTRIRDRHLCAAGRQAQICPRNPAINYWAYCLSTLVE